MSMATAKPPAVAGTRPDGARPVFNGEKIRADFPILTTLCHGKRLAYLDNAATSQKPRCVIDAVTRYYQSQNANIHRGVYSLSEEATGAYEAGREAARRFLHARDAREIIFVRGTTEAINLVASAYGQRNIAAGDDIILSAMEHHSNIVPWQLLCERTGAHLRVIPMNDRGELCMDAYEKLFGPRTRFVSVVHVSNSLGTVNPVKEIVRIAHSHGVPVMLDGAQAAWHLPINVQELDCDFYAFSGHKTCGPTGIGVLYGKLNFLEKMPPYQGGGDMIASVTFEKTTYADVPHRFEAGTPNIAGVIGLHAALDYLAAVEGPEMLAHERDLLAYAQQRMAEAPGLRIVGTAADKISVISFVLEHVHPHDIGTILDGEGVAVRTGHHCCQPVMDRLAIPATARASLAFYNNQADVDQLVAGLRRVLEVFA